MIFIFRGTSSVLKGYTNANWISDETEFTLGVGEIL